MDINDIADNYERRYGFMAVNATMRAAKMFHRVHATNMVSELELVNRELVRRGISVVRTQEEYDAGVRKYGVPLEWREESSENDPEV